MEEASSSNEKGASGKGPVDPPPGLHTRELTQTVKRAVSFRELAGLESAHAVQPGRLMKKSEIPEVITHGILLFLRP